MERRGRFDTRVWYAKQGYKEMHIPAKDGSYVFPANYLHIWPRGANMLIALPNMDGPFLVCKTGIGSFTSTLFADHDELEKMEREWSASRRP